MKRRLNARFLVCLLVPVALLGGGVHVLHGYQVRRNARDLLWQANWAEEHGRPGPAAKYLGLYLGFVPSDTDALAKWGQILHKLAASREEQLRAFLVLEQVLRREPGRHELRRQQAARAMELERFTDAREHLERLLKETAPDDGQLEQLLGRCHEAAKDFDKAAEWLTAAVRHAPHHVEAYVGLADVLRRRLNQPKRADEVMDALVAANPKAFRAFLARGLYWQEHGAPERARADVSRARDLAPEHADVLLAAADLARLDKDYDAARAALRHCLDLHPHHPLIVQALARVEVEAGRPAEAIACLRRELRTLPERAQPELRWALADLLIEQGEDAGEVIERLRQDGLPVAQLDFLTARAAAQKGEWGKASKTLERIRSELLRWPQLTKQADLLLGRCYAQLGDADQQYAAFHRAVSLDASWEPAFLGMASALAAMGKTEEALEVYGKLAAKMPSVRLVVARLLILKNLRLPRARQDWRQVDQALDEAARVTPEAVEIHVLRAEALAARGEYERGAALLRDAQARHARELALWVSLAGLAERQNRWDEAQAVLDEAERHGGDTVGLRVARSRHWAGRGGAAARPALAKLAEGVEKFSVHDQRKLLHAVAEDFARLGETGAAGRLWGRLAEQQPNDLTVKLRLFDLALQAKDEAALTRLVEDIRRVEGADGTLWRYGKVCLLIWQARRGAKETLDEARDLLALITARRPAWPRGPVCEGEISELKGDAQAAVRAYQRAVELGERNPLVIRRAVQLLFEHRRFLEADQLIQKLPEQAVLSADLRRLTAEISLRMNDYGRALSLAQKAVADQSKDYRDYVWLGQVLWAADRGAEAEPVLRRAVELAGNVPDAWVALIQYLARTGQQEKAEAALREARDKLRREQAPLALAQCYEAVNRPDQALELYRTALAAHPEDIATLRGVASFYLRQGRADDARPHLEKTIALRVKSPEDAAWARRILAIVYATSDDYQRSHQALAILGILDDAGRSDPRADESPEDLRAKAMVLAAQKTRVQRRAAIRLLEHLGSRQPLNPDDQFLLAQLYESVEDWPKAHQHLLSLLAAHSEKALYLTHYTRALLRRGETAEAEVWLNKLRRLPDAAGTFGLAEVQARSLAAGKKAAEAVTVVTTYVNDGQSKPGDPGARLRLAAALLEELGRAFPAEKAFAAAAESLYRDQAASQPDQALALAAFLSRQGRLPEALDLCERAWQTCPAEAVGHAAVAALQAGQGDAEQYRRVERWIEAALAKSANPTAMQVCLAYLRDLQGRHNEAATLYLQVIARDPRNAIALNNLASLLALKDRQAATALGLIKRAIDVAGPLPELLDTRAVVHLAQGQTDAAIKDLEEAIAGNPLAPIYFHLAQAYDVARKPTEAKSSLQKALAAGLKPHDLHPLERPAYQQLLGKLGL